MSSVKFNRVRATNLQTGTEGEYCPGDVAIYTDVNTGQVQACWHGDGNLGDWRYGGDLQDLCYTMKIQDNAESRKRLDKILQGTAFEDDRINFLIDKNEHKQVIQKEERERKARELKELNSISTFGLF